MDTSIRESLRRAYQSKAGERDARAIQPWKANERQRFYRRLQSEGHRRLLEIGSGPGWDGSYFHRRGIDVVCSDLTPAMTQLCRAKGLPAIQMDASKPCFAGRTFEAIYAVNSLLHLPKRELPIALQAIRMVLEPGGLFFIGVYGGKDFEGVWEDDIYQPKRFFSFYRDQHILAIVGASFSVIDFHSVALEANAKALHFQSLTLRRKG